MGRYMREHRLLNSMLMSLLIMLILFWLLWDLILFAAIGSPDGTDTLSDIETLHFKEDAQSHTITTGRAIDGYIEGATGFADANGDRIQDGNEAAVTTGTDGA